MKLEMNLLAGLVNSVWSALIGLAVIPFYLKYLGMEAYGLIGFFITTQAVLSLLDMGMVPTINREVARYSATGNLSEVGTLLHTLAIVYWSIAGVIALLLALVAPWIAEYWIESKHIASQTVSHAVMLMAVVIACRWPIGLYQGALIGAQRLGVSSCINIAMTTISSMGAVMVLAFVSPTIEAFFIWQTCVGIIYVISIKFAAWQIIGTKRKSDFDLSMLRKVWHFTAGVSVISLMGIIFTQLDKVLLSKLLSLEGFAQYMLATVVASGLYALITPFYNVVYPRFSALVAANNIKDLIDLYRLSTRLLAIVMFPITMILSVFSYDLVYIWTGNLSLALNTAPIIELLVIGSALNGIMFIPHALLLAFGMTRIPIIINGVLMIFFLPLITFFALAYGALGAAIAWLMLQAAYVLFGTWLTHRNILRGGAKTWMFNDVGIPLVSALISGIIYKYICENSEFSVGTKLATVCFLALCSVVVGVILTPKIITIITHFFNAKRNTGDIGWR